MKAPAKTGNSNHAFTTRLNLQKEDAGCGQTSRDMASAKLSYKDIPQNDDHYHIQDRWRVIVRGSVMVTL